MKPMSLIKEFTVQVTMIVISLQELNHQSLPEHDGQVDPGGCDRLS